MKLKTILILVFLLITALTIAYIDYRIRNYDLRFYSGKDGGYFKRFESIVILSTLFYLLNAIRPKGKPKDYFIYGLTGFILGIFVGFSCYILVPSDYYGMTYHIVSIGICYSSIYILRKMKQIIAKKASAD